MLILTILLPFIVLLLGWQIWARVNHRKVSSGTAEAAASTTCSNRPPVACQHTHTEHQRLPMVPVDRPLFSLLRRSSSEAHRSVWDQHQSKTMSQPPLHPSVWPTPCHAPTASLLRSPALELFIWNQRGRGRMCRCASVRVSGRGGVRRHQGSSDVLKDPLTKTMKAIPLGLNRYSVRPSIKNSAILGTRSSQACRNRVLKAILNNISFT